MALEIIPISQNKAFAWIDKHHRHLGAPAGDLFRVACVEVLGEDVRLCGVATVGRPVSRMIQLQEPLTCEVTRNCTDGTRNACSKLYGAAWRVARALGWTKLITYTLPNEGGASLRAAGYRVVGQTKAESWHRKARPRVDKAPLCEKLIWVREVAS